MAQLRSDIEFQEVKSTLTAEELRAMNRILSYSYEETTPLPTVPAHMRATGDAARCADERCLRELAANANARAASWSLAGDSSLGR